MKFLNLFFYCVLLLSSSISFADNDELPYFIDVLYPIEKDLPYSQTLVECPWLVTNLSDRHRKDINVDCGIQSVPKLRNKDSDLNDQTKIFFTHFKIASKISKPALVIAQGGPGGSSAELAAAYILANPKLVEEFNVIAVDIRGLIHSRLSSICLISDEDQKTMLNHSSFYENQITAMKLEEKIKKDCVKRYQYNLPYISTYEIASDIVDVTKALGYSAFSFYGVSYGTMIGQYLIKYHNKHLNKVVFDGAVQPGEPWQNDALESLPSLIKKRIKLFIESSSANKFGITTTDEFLSVLRKFSQKLRTASDKESIHILPSALLFKIHSLSPEEISEKLVPMMKLDLGELDKLVDEILLESNRNFSNLETSAVYSQLICTEFTSKLNIVFPKNLSDLLEYVADDEAILEKLTFTKEEPCTWLESLDSLSPVIKSAIKTDKEYLITSGALDHVTLPKHMHAMSKHSPNAIKITFENLGHGVFLESECSSKTIINYLAGNAARNYCEIP